MSDMNQTQPNLHNKVQS